MDNTTTHDLGWTELKIAMQACRQSAAQTIWEHGEAVRDKFLDLHSHLAHGTPLAGSWRLPEWLSPDLLPDLLPIERLSLYHLWHDCGKPFCRTVDEAGRQHFPGHAEESRRRWLAAGGGHDIGALIGMDMDIHLLKTDGIAEFSRRPQAVSLLLTGLAEIHANADMFGGIDSTSFKIKWKALDKAGRRLLDYLGIQRREIDQALPTLT